MDTDFTENGTRYRRPLKTKSWQEARTEERKIIESARAGKLADSIAPKRLFEDHLFGLSGDVASNAVEVYIHRLRKQLSERGAKVQIHTIRGVGYLISEDKAA